MSNSGDAIGHLKEGKIIFVAGGVPGDKVLVSIVENKKNYARAKVITLLEKGIDRIQAPCELAVDYCGGCPLMIIKRETQLTIKEDFVKQALRKIHAPIYPLIAPVDHLHYRIRARFVRKNGILGFQASRSHNVSKILHCPVLHPRLDKVLCEAAKEIEPYIGEDGTISGLVGLHKEIHFNIVLGFGSDPIATENLIVKWIAENLIVGASLNGKKIGQQTINVGSKENPLWISASGFAQASDMGHSLLPEFVQNTLKQLNTNKPWKRLLEIYAGSGNFTRYLYPLAQEVIAIEGDPEAAERLKHLLQGHVYVYATSAQAGLVTLEEEQKEFEVAVLDPPRIGAKDIIALLGKLVSQTIIYVSCDPMTLARDLLLFEKEGFQVDWIQPFDLMPHTTQIELVAKLQKI